MATFHGLTLLDVIQAVSEVAENDLEIIATVVHLISSGQVRLQNDAIGAMRHLVATVDAAAQGSAEEHTRQWYYGDTGCGYRLVNHRPMVFLNRVVLHR
jgi:hypothetical protein